MNGSTVVILGAGASKPYGLPLGRELPDLVLKDSDTRPNNQTPQAITTFLTEISKILQSDLQTSAISNGRCILRETSFMDENCKIATAIALDGKEKEEKLFPPNQP